MKILYTITKSEIGGAQVHVAELAKAMKDNGHAVAIVSNSGGWLEYEATRLGIRFYQNPYFANSFNPIRILKSFITIKKIISEFNPDVVHCHSSFAGVITRLVVRLKIPTIFTAHSFAFTDGASFLRKVIAIVIERYMERYTSKIICVSNFDRNLALKYKIVKSEKLTTIYNGVSKNNFIVAEKENTILTIGRLAYPKEYLLLLDAYKLSGVSIQLKIVSDGPHRKIIESKIRELGLEKMVLMMGDLDREEVKSELLKSRMFILISKHEGLPISIIEAMSVGLPVIASNVGGIPEEIDKTCGILVNNKKDEIAEAIKILNNEDLQKQMGEMAKKRFEEIFTLEKFVSETEKIYHELVSKNNLNSF